MSTDQMLIHELAEQAKTTVRTIRYYTNEGLLPQPVIQGKYAYFTLIHLDRLELIRRMKDAYLPLREIRQVMNSLTDEEVRQRLAEKTPSSPKAELGSNPTQSKETSGSSALAYIAKLMDEQTGHKSEGTVRSSSPPFQRNKDNLMPLIGDPFSSQNAALPIENWRRIVLVSGVELHVHEPTDPKIDSLIQQLIEFSKKLFTQS